MKPRTKTLQIRLRDSEYAKIERAAFESRMKVSEYARAALIGAPAKVVVGIDTAFGADASTIRVVPTKEKYEVVRDEDYQGMD